MKKENFFKITYVLVLLVLASCSTSAQELPQPQETVEITDAHGKVNVPVNPKVVIGLDSRTFETLEDWGIELAAVPKDVMSADSLYVKDESVVNIGNHREPNLELIASLEPDLVIIGQRFGAFYDEIKALVPNAVVIDLTIETGDDYIKGLKEGTTTLGQIFNKEKEAQALIGQLDEVVSQTKKVVNQSDTVMSVVVSGANIGFVAPSVGRVFGPIYDALGLVPALEVNNASSDHKGDDISVEAIAQSNPDYLFVLDRDAGVNSTEKYTPARDVISHAPALKNTKAIQNNNIYYAPDDTYTNESIQTIIKIFEGIKDLLSK